MKSSTFKPTHFLQQFIYILKTIIPKPELAQIFSYIDNSLFYTFLHIFQCSYNNVSSMITIGNMTLIFTISKVQTLNEWMKCRLITQQRYTACFPNPPRYSMLQQFQVFMLLICQQVLNKSVAYSSQGSHTGQLDFCN